MAARLLAAYPELSGVLQMETVVASSARDRLGEVAVRRLNELVRSILIFEDLSIAEQELRWAVGVLPRHGVKMRHQATMVHWFFEEVERLDLAKEERTLVHSIEHYLMNVVETVYAA
ncbi:MAG: hypothetical protein HC911_13130 [Chloroflexaceae bacterium]|nr:hypothetical protein [Chloroflexaceae bacterium]